MDPYSFDFMVKDRIRELLGEAAGRQRITNGNKRHLRTWLVAVVHLWAPSAAEPVLAPGCDDPGCEGIEEHQQDASA